MEVLCSIVGDFFGFGSDFGKGRDSGNRLQFGDASKVAPIDKLSVALAIILGIVVLGERADPKVLIGGGFIVLGSLVILWK